MRMTKQMQAALYWARHRRLEFLNMDPAAKALFARMSVQPNDARKAVINNLIKSFKSSGFWAKSDCIYIVAAHDAQAARLNWKADQFNLTAVNAPTFTVDRGYAGNGTTSYLDTGFNGSTAGGLFTQNSAHVGAWNRTSRAGADLCLLGIRASTTNYTNLFPRSSGNAFIGRVNGPTNHLSVAETESKGHFLANRSGATAAEGYKNGASVVSNSAASVAIPNGNILLLARGVVSGSPDTFSTDQIAQASIGASLSGAEVTAMYNALLTYMSAVGA